MLHSLRLLSACFVAPAIIMLMSLHAVGQNTEKRSEQGQTIDAWRNAVPETEQPASPTPEAGETNAEGAEVFDPAEAQIKLIALEEAWLEAVERRDEKILSTILAPDFTFADERSSARPLDRAKYIERVMLPRRTGTYRLDRTVVRFYGETALVQTWYVPRNEMAVGKAGEGFWATDFWIREANLWKVVARHASRATAK